MSRLGHHVQRTDEVLGSVVPAAAVPVPFLLSLLWTAGVSVRLAIRADSGGASAA